MSSSSISGDFAAATVTARLSRTIGAGFSVSGDCSGAGVERCGRGGGGPPIGPPTIPPSAAIRAAIPPLAGGVVGGSLVVPARPLGDGGFSDSGGFDLEAFAWNTTPPFDAVPDGAFSSFF